MSGRESAESSEEECATNVIKKCLLCDERTSRRMKKCDQCANVVHYRCIGMGYSTDRDTPFSCAECAPDGDVTDQTATPVSPNAQEDPLDKLDTIEALREAARQFRKETERITWLQEKQRDSMGLKIVHLQEEYAESARRNARSNERHTKQIAELQKSMDKMRERRQTKVSPGKEDPEVAKIRKRKEAMELKKRALDEEIQQISDDLASLKGAKPKRRTVIEEDSDDEIYRARSPNPSVYSRYVEDSALDLLAITMRRTTIQQLPTFSGDCKEWPLFEAVYKRTTQDGRFSDRENIERLGKALKGEARETVVNLLMFSEEAQEIMDELSKVYGRPERVIVGLMSDILAMKPPKEQPEYKLRDFAVKVRNFAASAKAMGMSYELDNEYALAQLASKIHPSAYREWMKIRLRQPKANIERFGEFLMDRVLLLPPEPTQIPRSIEQQPERTNRSNRNHGRMFAHRDISGSNGFKCLRCQKAHETAKCFALPRMSFEELQEFVARNRICKACLNSTDHRWRECPQKMRCNKNGCTQPHHPLLHEEGTSAVYAHQSREAPAVSGSQRSVSGTNQRSTTEVVSEQRQAGSMVQPATTDMRLPAVRAFRQTASNRSPAESEPHAYSNTHQNASTSKVLFKVVPVTLFGNDDIVIRTHALLDDGSGITLMEEKLFHDLHLEGERRLLTLQWTGEMTRTEESYVTNLALSGVKNRKVHKLLEVSTVKNLALPSQTVVIRELQERCSHLRDLPLEDMRDAKPELLIGLRQAKLLVSHKVRAGADDEPVAIRTALGWLVFGSSAPSFNFVALNQEIRHGHFQLHMTEPPNLDQDLHQLVKGYFTTENFGVAPPKANYALTEEEKRADAIIEKTMKLSGGRAEIGLLWKDDEVVLPDYYPMAKRRLFSLEKSLLKQPELLEWTTNHISGLVEKGHARIASPDELMKAWKRVAYIPGFTIVNENKSPPKPRFVLDFAAAATSGGKSVNSELLKGPDNLAPMLHGLCRFREQKIAVNADVKEMFHQIKIREEDQQSQRFLWRDADTTREPTVYIMQVMAFGPKCSPACAQAVKNTHAEKYRAECPQAVEALIKTTYVDDYFNSHATVDEAVQVSLDAIRICNDISFPLVGFQSNQPDMLKQLPQEHVKEAFVSMDPEEARSLIAKVLGMYWDPLLDVFIYKLHTNNMVEKMLDETHHPTKRELLTTLMKVFDPLGLIAHYLIRAKMILQEVWRDGTNWDEPINARLLMPWREWVKELQNIEMIKIPRQYAPVNPLETKVQLIIFVDASETGFAATGYFLFTTNDHSHVAHVMAKAKVAPLKQLSMPKLELQGAVLGVRTATSIKDLHSFPIDDVLFLSDSRVVLAWITARNLKLKQFVALRISEILDGSTRAQWYHIGSKHNVADDGTKCNDPTMGNTTTRWFKGADFLSKPREEWPITAALELESQTVVSAVHCIPPTIPLSFTTLDDIAEKYKSKWATYVRILARILKLSLKNNTNTGFIRCNYINPKELRRAEEILFRKIQVDSFPNEVTALMNGEAVHKASSILSLTPRLAADGVIRLSSRAQQANTSYAARNPAVLPNKHELVDLMIQHYHELNFHIAEDTTIADIRERAWIVHIRSALARVRKSCAYCILRKAQPQMPLMGQLPPARLDFSAKPFTHVGVDCFGHYDVKFGRGKVKRWILLFTCLTFRAVHLEMLNNMSTDECLAAIRRFQARRGRNLQFYSDCGTNFVGADRQLQRDVADMRRTLCESVAQEFSVKWQFQPAYAPWRGGAWERLIKSIKKCIDYVFVGENPREDILRNAMTEAETRMNQRPLTHVPVDPEDEKPLTPNMALFGDEELSMSVAPGTFSDCDAYSKSAYRRSQHLADKMFSRWLKDYLPTIVRRPKWLTEVKPAQVNDLAILIDPTQPRDAWKLGRLTAIYPGPDGRVRSADILLKDGSMKKNRSIGRLAILDLDQSSN